MKQQLFRVALTPVTQRERAGRARLAPQQALGGKFQAVIHAGHGPRLSAAVGKGGELTTPTAEFARPAGVRSDFAAFDDQSGQTLHHFGWHAGHATGKADVVEAVLVGPGARTRSTSVA